ncbi:neutral zinc metallopeptidase [Nocardiopsis sp. JB363]|uniref:neutral zinc metallopeptidase n=1 Tax=Nocardiopsis sp. JB363 TaxID=1434837 RepID=UPI000979C8AE|nr:neutral zinc metallopeptidase [Nocardiopsis sp. JB363]SIO91329.1 YpfJ protein, zinc metalloprotease superfamily [Nocardiopsis sp. JB363]
MVRRARPAPDLDPWAEPRGFLQRMGLGVSLSLGTGLAAVGFTGFLAISAMLPGAEPAWGDPVGTDPTELMSADAEGRPVDHPDARIDDPLGQNPLYATGELGEVTCSPPTLDQEDPRSVEVFVHAIADCLDTAWAAYFDEAGLPFSSPNRIYWHDEGHSPCGPFPSGGTAAFYCQANQGLYLGVKDIVAASASSEEPEAYTFLLSHEYGHHVQGQSRMLAEFHALRANADDETADELTRRNELQANCLGGVFVGSAEESLGYQERERENILDDVVRRSDHAGTGTHGSTENGRLWTAHGLDRMDPAACNTWEAREELVR